MLKYIYGLATDKYNGVLPSIFKTLLYFLSLVYGLGVRFIAFWQRANSRYLPCKAISVGNITLGGTGKTVIVEYLARRLSSSGQKVAVLTRGYKSKLANDERRTTSYETMGDEPSMLKKKLPGIPVIVDPDRERGAFKAVREHGADTVILDDGFQQWRIKKSLDIVAIDIVNPFGNGCVIPRGILREPLSALSRADVFILTKSADNTDTGALRQRLANINPKAIIIESTHKACGFYDIAHPLEVIPLDKFKSRDAALFCGIGDPGSFESLVTKQGIRAGILSVFSDHYHYVQADLDKIIRDAKAKNIDTLITTEKDAVRLEGLKIEGAKVFVLKIELKINKDEELFVRRLSGLYVG